MEDEKDRLADKLQKKEKAEEDRFIAERERAALARLRRQHAGESDLRCPSCGTSLTCVEHQGVRADECPACQGIWLDSKAVAALAPRERESWIGRFFYRPKPVV